MKTMKINKTCLNIYTFYSVIIQHINPTLNILNLYTITFISQYVSDASLFSGSHYATFNNSITNCIYIYIYWNIIIWFSGRLSEVPKIKLILSNIY